MGDAPNTDAALTCRVYADGIPSPGRIARRLENIVGVLRHTTTTNR